MRTGPPNFLGLEDRIACDPEAPAVVLPIPYEKTVCYGGGTGYGPRAVLEASTQVELFDEEYNIQPEWRVQTLPALDLGGMDPPDAMNAIRCAAEPIFQQRRFLLALGGEHSITPPLVAAAKQIWTNLDVLLLDAHADLRDTYQETPYSHACTGRRLVELGVGTIWMGVRSFSEEEFKFARLQRLTLLRASEMRAHPVKQLAAVILDRLARYVYLSIDVDVFDPSLVPGTGTPEPGGLDWPTVLEIIRMLCREKSVVGADITELSPIPGIRVSEYVAARLAAKLLLEAVFRG